MTHIARRCSKSASEVARMPSLPCDPTLLSKACSFGLLAAAVAVTAAMMVATPCAAETGKAFFQTNCASCHGDHARGDGKMAALLDTEVADLTKLARTNGGTFPTARVIRRIDGSELVESHGKPKPIWTKRLRTNSPTLVSTDMGELEVAPAVADLILWLESIQR